jgi:hypothetical protein
MPSITGQHEPAAVDRRELDRHILQTDREVANGDVHDLHFPTGRALAEALGYRASLLDRLPAEAAASFAGVGYHLGLGGCGPASACWTSAAAPAWTCSRPPSR